MAGGGTLEEVPMSGTRRAVVLDAPGPPNALQIRELPHSLASARLGSDSCRGVRSQPFGGVRKVVECWAGNAPLVSSRPPAHLAIGASRSPAQALPECMDGSDHLRNARVDRWTTHQVAGFRHASPAQVSYCFEPFQESRPGHRRCRGAHGAAHRQPRRPRRALDRGTVSFPYGTGTPHR